MHDLQQGSFTVLVNMNGKNWIILYDKDQVHKEVCITIEIYLHKAEGLWNVLKSAFIAEYKNKLPL